MRKDAADEYGYSRPSDGSVEMAGRLLKAMHHRRPGPIDVYPSLAFGLRTRIVIATGAREPWPNACHPRRGASPRIGLPASDACGSRGTIRCRLPAPR